ncbi:hypothetical protein Tco_1063779 [Tanacetum coccineum]
MDLETAQITTTAKLPTLKHGEYDMWRLRIEQYFQVQDYALWDVIENGNSFKPAAKTTTNVDGTSTTLIPGPVTTEEKVQKKNDMNARSFRRLNKPDLDTMSFDDLYNNFKIVEQEVKGTASSSSSSNSQNMAFVTANLCDDIVYAFLVSQPNGSQLVHKDLEQIHEDDLEEMDLKWQWSVSTSSKAMLVIDGVGFDWSYMADDEVLTNMALMAFSDSEFNKSEFNLANYKRGLASVEEQLVFYKKNEVIFCEQLVVLKRDISYKDSKISMLKSELEKLKQEKESNQLKIENFNNASKSLDKLIGSQIFYKSRKEEFQQPEFKGYGPKTSKNVSEDTSNEVRESPNAPMVEKLVSDDKSQGPRGNQRNWNNQKSQQLESDFVVYNKACFVCGSFNHVQANCNYHQRERVVSENNYTRVNYNYSTKKAHPSAHRNMAPRAVLMKTSLRPLNTARPINTAHPKTTVYSVGPMSCFSKSAQSTVKRPYQIKTALTNKNFSQKVNSAKESFYTARPKAVNTARLNSAVVNVVRANQVNVVKASACWVWRATKLNSASITLKKHNYVDVRGRSKYMTGNMSYLSDFKGIYDEGDMIPFGRERQTYTACYLFLSPDFKVSLINKLDLLKVPRFTMGYPYISDQGKET